MAKPTRKSAVTLDQAKALVSVARTGSFERTANELGLRWPASVFHLIGRMETTLDRGALVGPSTQGSAKLTAAGSEVLPMARALVEAYAAFSDGRHEIRISGYPSVAGRLARTISDYDGLHENIDVALYEIADQSRRDRGEGLFERATTGEIDLVVLPSDYSSPLLKSRKAYSWTLRVVLADGDPRRERATITVSDLNDLGFLVSPLGHSSRRLFDTLARETKERPRVAMELVDQYVLEQIAREGRRYAAVIPDDAFGAPNPLMGPALVGRDRRRRGGSYSLYYLSNHHALARRGSSRSEAVLELSDEITRTLAPKPS
jgi:DNA-binding transcriptional LysR family regulator